MRTIGVTLLALSLVSIGTAAAVPAEGSSKSPPASDVDKLPSATIVVGPQETGRALSPVLQGVNMHDFSNDAAGLWDAQAGAPNADAAAKIARAGIGLLRFPSGSSGNLYDWKRSIGPSASRECQTDGVQFAPRNETDYGPDEFMELVHAVGSEPEIAVPFPNAAPDDVADWFEYMNAPVGTNPNGGVAWAEVRQQNGSSEPYGVTRWEIGNEPYLRHQAFWTDAEDPVHRLAQFIEGDEIDFVDQPLGRNCNFDPPPLTSRNPSQQFFFMYRLIKEGTSPVIKVGDVTWTEVPDLAAAGPTDSVYELDRNIGAVTLGDGVHGAIPPRNLLVTASYTFKHEGYAKAYDALKATANDIGLDVDVCAAWAPISPRGTSPEDLGWPSFAQEMRRRALADRYDCVAAHPYTSLGTDFWPWESAEDAHHAHMVGDEYAQTVISALDADLKANSADHDAFVAVTELGALWFGAGPEREQSVAHMPQFSSTMTHAVYMASQWLRYADSDIGWVMGNALAPPGLRGVLGGVNTGFVYSAEASAREALKPVFRPGGFLTETRLMQQTYLTAPDGSTWPVLMVAGAKAADGVLHVVVVNRHTRDAQVARIVPAGFQRDRVIDVATVRGDSFMSFNDDGTFGGDNTVKLTRSTTETKGQGSFEFEFPAASITVLALQPR